MIQSKHSLLCSIHVSKVGETSHNGDPRTISIVLNGLLDWLILPLFQCLKVGWIVVKLLDQLEKREAGHGVPTVDSPHMTT